MVLPVCPLSLCRGSLREIDALDALERTVIRDDHPVAGRETPEHFELLGIAATRLDRAAVSGTAVGAQHEYPVPARAFEECTGRQHQRLAILTEGELTLQ